MEEDSKDNEENPEAAVALEWPEDDPPEKPVVGVESSHSSHDQESNFEILTEWLAKMELTSAMWLRATPVHRVLAYAGRPLRRNTKVEFNCHTVKEIKAFISHSWHTSPWSKIVALLIFYNWKAALLVGYLVGVLSATCFAFDWLPGFTRQPRFGEPVLQGLWSLGLGLLGSLIVFVLRRPSEMVFLDILCIDQKNSHAKMQGVLNIGGCLRHSKNLLVIWDETYCQRLWCMFELAAFLKTHEEHHVLVRPVALSYLVVGSLVLNTLVWSASPLLPYDAPYTLYVILLGLMVYTWFVSHMWLSYSDGSESALRELKKFRMADAKCLCCSLNHVTPKGQKILTCDRELISTCVEQWFGSIEEFEKSVQNQVLRALSRGLGGIFIPYPLMLLQVLPFTLTNMDFTAARLHGQAYSDVAASAMICVFGTLVCTPMGYAVLYLAIQYTRGCRRMLRTLLVCVMFGLQQLFVQWSLQMCVDFAGQLRGISLWVGMQFVPTLLLWWWALRVGRREVMCT